MTTDERYEQQACELVLQDLIDCLLAEQFFEGAEQQLLSVDQFQAFCAGQDGLANRLQFPALPAHGLIWQWTISSAPLHCVAVPVMRGIVQPIQRIPGMPAYAVKFESGRQDFQLLRLSAVEFMKLVIAHAPDGFLDRNSEGASLFLEWVRETVRQTTWSLAHKVGTSDLLAKTPADFFQTLEQCSSLRDRPFHPVAKAKKGFTKDAYHAYMAEFGREVQLNWVAVDSRALDCGAGIDDPQCTRPEHFLLSEGQQAALRQEMQLRGIDRSHVALPVHPWQLQHVLPKQLAAELRTGICVPLDFREGSFLPTSSVRSLAPTTASPHYLKLPLGIYSLGACRYLPAIKMINGQRSEKLLRDAMALDGLLAQRVFICDETKWWAYLPEQATLFDEAPRHLSAMVRSYPPALMQDPECRLIPMAALGVAMQEHASHFFDEWLRYRKLVPDSAAVSMLFQELCDTFLEINLRMFRLGILAEVHGQNAVLVWRSGRVFGLLLRDHDSLRVHVPWLQRHGLADPEYRLKPGHANTLYHETPEDLLFYLQTLAVQVNLRAIIEVLATRYGIDQQSLWFTLQQALAQAIDRVGFADDVRNMLRQRLFEDSAWPLKLLIRPMIERAAGPGSMPFGIGRTRNPFLPLVQPADTGSNPADQAEGACAVTS